MKPLLLFFRGNFFYIFCQKHNNRRHYVYVKPNKALRGFILIQVRCRKENMYKVYNSS